MTKQTKGLIRFGVACALCLSYPMMVYLAFNADASLTAVMIGGYVALVIVMLYGADPLVDLVEAWRG